MQAVEGKTRDTLVRSRNFLVVNVALVGDLSQSSAYQALDTAITQLTEQAANQAAGAVNGVGSTADQAKLRQTLRVNFITPIVTIAKAQAATLPDLAKLRMPPSNATVTRLVAAASAMAEAVAANLAVFTGAGLPADIVPQLQAAAAAVSASVDARAADKGRRVQATSGLASAAKDGMTALRILNTIVAPKLQGSPLLAEWKSAIKVNAKSGAAAGTVVPGPVVAPTSNSSASARAEQAATPPGTATTVSEHVPDLARATQEVRAA